MDKYNEPCKTCEKRLRDYCAHNKTMVYKIDNCVGAPVKQYDSKLDQYYIQDDYGKWYIPKTLELEYGVHR